MKLLRVAAAVLNQTPLDWRGNLANVRAAIASARDQGATVLCLPELCLCGYGCEDAFQSPNTQRMALRLLHEVLPDTVGMVVSLGLPLVVNNGLFNVAALIADGRILGGRHPL
jgi:NAD+ synthase (glutamine-hydrolysing)